MNMFSLANILQLGPTSKISRASQNSATSWEPCLPHRSLLGEHFLSKSQQEKTTVTGRKAGKAKRSPAGAYPGQEA